MMDCGNLEICLEQTPLPSGAVVQQTLLLGHPANCDITRRYLMTQHCHMAV